jgi:hypothetical protein
MPIRRHNRLEFSEARDVALAFILNRHLHVEFFRKRRQIFNDGWVFLPGRST